MAGRLAVLALSLALWAATPAPVSTAGNAVRGTATWYCGAGSGCTRGYGLDDLVAAIDRKDTPWDKGDRLTVTSGGRSVTVLVVDVCGCPGNRIIDLTSAAFRRLGPLSAGVIPVVVTAAGKSRPTPTPTARPTAKPTARATPKPTAKPKFVKPKFVKPRPTPVKPRMTPVKPRMTLPPTDTQS